MVRFSRRMGNGVDDETVDVGLRLKRENAIVKCVVCDLISDEMFWVGWRRSMKLKKARV